MRIGFFIVWRAFELRQQLVEIVDVPGSVDLGQHDDVELVADSADDLDHVVERPGRIECVDARPQSGRPEIDLLRHLDEAFARGLLGLDRNGVFQIAEHHVDLPHKLRHLGAHLFVDAAARNGSCAPAGPATRAKAPARRRRAGQRTGVEASWRSFHKVALPFRAMQRPRQVGRVRPNVSRQPCSGAAMQPLSGLLVLDFTTLLPGPLATLDAGGSRCRGASRSNSRAARTCGTFRRWSAAKARPSPCSTAARQSLALDLKSEARIAPSSPNSSNVPIFSLSNSVRA